MNSFDLFGNPTGSDQRAERSDDTATEYSTPLDGIEGDVEEVRQPRSFSGLALTGCIIATVIGVQCYLLQVKGAQFNRAKAEGNTVRFLSIPADRGLIEDANGTILTQNSSHMALAINPQTLPSNQAQREAVYALLKQKAGIDDATITFIEKSRKTSPDSFPIKINLSKQDQLLYTEWFASTPGVVLQETPTRLYTAFPSEGQLIGYVGTASTQDVTDGHSPNEQVGKTGLEKQYNDALSGTPGKQQAEVNAQGEIVRIVASSADQDAQPGKTLKLNINLKLQNILYTALSNELARRDIKFGPEPTLGLSGVIMDPNTGAVLAMVSLPDYNSQQFADGISTADYNALLNAPGNPLLNRTIQGQFPSGSTIKPFVGAAALQAGTITRDFSWVTPCAINVGSFNFPDWTCHHTAYSSTVATAIKDSNDVFFYAIGGGYAPANIKGLGINTMNQYLALFGFGSKSNVDLPSESSGLLADDTWKRKNIGEPWYLGDTYHASIGQGYFLTTPLQLAAATSAIANGGTLYKPQIAQGYVDPKTGKEDLIPPTVVRSGFIDPANVQEIQQGMRDVVLTGSGRPLNTLQVQSAGKTGSAQVGIHNQAYDTSYVGYAPYDKPQIVWSVILEGDDESYHSSVPVSEEILRAYFNEPLAPGQQLSSSLNLSADFRGEH